MIKEAIEKILSLKRPETIEVDGRPYSTYGLFAIQDPMPEIMGIETLTGIVDYIETNRDSLDKTMLFLHISDFRAVSLCEMLTKRFLQRKIFLSARHNDNGYRFGIFLDTEQFIIAMQSQFVQDDVTAKILGVVGALTHSAGITQLDDGVTQEVTAKTGITKVGSVDVPNPVILMPYRTFLEIEQPKSTFVLRMKYSQNEGITCALFEADGGLWKLEAITKIRDWLKKKIGDVPVIA